MFFFIPNLGEFIRFLKSWTVLSLRQRFSDEQSFIEGTIQFLGYVSEWMISKKGPLTLELRIYIPDPCLEQSLRLKTTFLNTFVCINTNKKFHIVKSGWTLYSTSSQLDKPAKVNNNPFLGQSYQVNVH